MAKTTNASHRHYLTGTLGATRSVIDGIAPKIGVVQHIELRKLGRRALCHHASPFEYVAVMRVA